jgi:hypothetical protein
MMEEVILQQLRQGVLEAYELSTDALSAMRRALGRVLERDDAPAELTRVLQLAVALERELGSPTAAQAIIDLLRSEPDAVDVVRGILAGRAAIDETRRFLRHEGRLETPRAPKHDAVAPPGTMQLSSLLGARRSAR